MTSSRYATGRVCQVVADDSVKCTKMASVHEKMVAQVSVVANAKWSLTQVLLYMEHHCGIIPVTSWQNITSSNAIESNLRRFIFQTIQWIRIRVSQTIPELWNLLVPDSVPSGWPCLGCSWSCQRLPARWASASLASASNVSSLVSQTFMYYMWHGICIFIFCDSWMYVAGK